MAALPPSVALPTRQLKTQGEVNCCVSCALAGALEAADPSMPALAPLYHFHLAGGAHFVEMGLTVHQAHVALARSGICAAPLHPFEITRANVGKAPDAGAMQDGPRRRPIDGSGALKWRPISPFAGTAVWRRLLVGGAPIVILFQPTAEYFTLNRANPVLRNTQSILPGVGHAAVVIGYQHADTDGVYVIQDSRGPNFGVDGQWFLPFELCSSPFIVFAIALASPNPE